MTYRHIYTDPNPCPCCEGYRTEPTGYYVTPDREGTGRKCADCGTTRPDAFDPDRDPFNPEREGWKGWGLDDYACPDYTQQTWECPPHSVSTIHAVTEQTEIWGEDHNEALYRSAPIPHRTVVSILIAAGYVPEVGV